MWDDGGPHEIPSRAAWARGLDSTALGLISWNTQLLHVTFDVIFFIWLLCAFVIIMWWL